MIEKYVTEDGMATLYCGDCMEVLPTLEVDKTWCICTDPPYGIDYGRAGGFSAIHGWGQWRENVQWDAQRPGRDVFDVMLQLEVPMVVWGGNYFTDYLPPRMGWIAWDKGQRNFSLADFELAWTSENKAARCVVFPRGLATKEKCGHPTQKPVEVMRQCITYLDRGRQSPIETVCDPFAGVASTGVAALSLGRRFIGIELDRHYFEIAKHRIDPACRGLNLHD